MPLPVKDNGGKDFKKVPQGVHAAVCNLVCDCGVQPGGKYKPQRKVYLRWEIPSERIEWTDKEGHPHEGPMTIGRFYTASLSEKATLRRDLENWRGKAFAKEELEGFDLFKILGTACQIMVAHNTEGGKTYANITGIMGLKKGDARPAAENTLIKYSPDEPQMFDQLPEWLRQKIADGGGASETTAPAADKDDFDDEIPF